MKGWVKGRNNALLLLFIKALSVASHVTEMIDDCNRTAFKGRIRTLNLILMSHDLVPSSTRSGSSCHCDQLVKLVLVKSYLDRPDDCKV